MKLSLFAPALAGTLALSPVLSASLFASLSASPALAQAASQHRAATHRAAPPSSSPALPKSIPPLAGVVHTAYALKYIDSKLGSGPLVQPGQFLTVHYTGWLTTGVKFDSSVDRGQPITFPSGAHRVIPGWDTGFDGMHVGGKRRLFIPYQLAYGEHGRPPVIPAKSDLIFDVELLAASDTPPPPPAQPGAPGQPAPPAAHQPGVTPPPASTSAPATPPATAAPATPPPATPPATPPSAATPPPTPPQ